MSIQNQAKTHDGVTLAITYTAGNTVVFDSSAGEDVVLFFNYTKGDETGGLEFRVRHISPDGVLHELGEAAGDVWSAIGDQQIPKPSGASVALAIQLLRVTGPIDIAVRFFGTSAVTPGTVIVNAVSGGARG